MGSLDVETNNKVLLVEDDDAYRYVVARLLRDCGLDVVDFGLASDALDFYERNPGIAMALVDVGMPDHSLTGLGFARMMRHRNRNARVVLFTGVSEYLEAPVSELFGEILFKTPNESDLIARMLERLGVRPNTSDVPDVRPPRAGSDGEQAGHAVG